MSDMADMALDAVMDDEEARLEYHTGHMSTIDAFERGLVDELGFEPNAHTRNYAMSDFDIKVKKLLSGIKNPNNTATFLQTLCMAPTINRDVQRKIVRDLEDRVFNTLSDTAFESMDDSDFDPLDYTGSDWDEGNRD